jgi:hypothetical protein
MLLADTPEEAKRLEKEVEGKLKVQGLSAHYLWHSDNEMTGLIDKIREVGCQMLVLPSNGPHLHSDTILLLLEELECPVLLVR